MPLALKNADSLLQDVLKAVDTNNDGHIEFLGALGKLLQAQSLLKTILEFRDFVEQTENQLWQLFKNIDLDHNGQLDKGELRAAFERAGILLPGAKLDQFFSEVDSNHDGVITFDEWRYPYSPLRACPTTDIIKRKFLLFIPANTPNLRTVLSYYSSTVTVNSEGMCTCQRPSRV